MKVEVAYRLGAPFFRHETSVENLKVAQASGTGIIGDPFAWWGARSAAGRIIARFHSGPNHCSVRSKTAVPIRLGSLSRGTLSIRYAAIGGSHGKDRDVVVGGGVAGLSAAAALHRHGFTTELVERQQSWHALGAGFLVQANGMRMLRSLGLGAGVEDAGAVVRRWQFCDEQGEVLSETDLVALWGDAGPCVGIERSKLQRALLPGVGNLRCRLGTSVISVVQDDRRVSVGFSDGSTEDYDLVVGADGIWSTVRALTLTAAVPSELGAMNWRSIAPIRPAGLTGLQMHMGDGCVFGLCLLAPGAPTVSPTSSGRASTIRSRVASAGCASVLRHSGGACRSIWPRPWNGWSSKNGIPAG